MIKEKFKNYNNLSQPVKASLWFTICSVITKGISFVTTPIFTRVLNTTQFGQYNVFMSWQSIIAIFATLQLYYGVFNNGMVKYENDKDGFVSSLQGLVTVITALIGSIFFLFRGILTKLMNISSFVMIAMFVEILFSASISLWAGRQRFDYKYRTLVMVTIAMAIANPVLGIFASLSTTNRGTARIISEVFIQLCFGGVIYIITLLKGKQFYNKYYWKYAFLFNLPLIPHYLAQTVLTQSDRIMINSICGASYAGIYGVAYSLSQVMNIVTNSINSSFVPWQYRKIREKSYKEISNVSNIMLIGLAMFIVMFIAVSPELMKIIASADYYDAIWVIPPLTLSLFFSFLYTLFANIEFYYEVRKFVLTASIASACLNLILNAVFIPILGYFVAGYVTLICFIFYCIGHYIFMNITLRKNDIFINMYSLKTISLITVAMFGFSVIFMVLYNHIIIRYSIIGMSLVLLYKKRKKIIRLFNTIKINI